MDRQSPRLQGPRPQRLSVSKDSHKVRKPLVVPLPHGAKQAQQQQQQQQQHELHEIQPQQQQRQQHQDPVTQPPVKN
jgi:hypothetical protein